jgi:hydrocephalus-inducing protein
MTGRLEPNEDKNIVVRFLSQKEIKLSTNKGSSDIQLVILEGDQKLEHQAIPILVNVNAVFSKYSISPLANLNFGPMQYGEQVSRTFEVRNEGLFDFKYAICDYANEEEKAKIREERQREVEGRLAEKAEEKEEAKGKKNTKAEAKPKAGAKGKGEAVPDGTVV